MCAVYSGFTLVDEMYSMYSTQYAHIDYSLTHQSHRSLHALVIGVGIY